MSWSTGIMMVLLLVSVGGYIIAVTGNESSSSDAPVSVLPASPEVSPGETPQLPEATSSQVGEGNYLGEGQGREVMTEGAVLSPQFLMEWYRTVDDKARESESRWYHRPLVAPVHVGTPPQTGWVSDEGMLLISFAGEGCTIDARVPAEFEPAMKPGSTIFIRGILTDIEGDRITLDQAQPVPALDADAPGLTAEYVCGWYAGVQQSLEDARQSFLGQQVGTKATVKHYGPSASGITSIRTEDGDIAVMVRIADEQAGSMHEGEEYSILGTLSGIGPGRIELSDCRIVAHD